MAQVIDPEMSKHLHELVKLHKVVFAVRPDLNYTKGEPRKIGFDLILYGTHAAPEHAPSPGCNECVQVWTDLYEIARAILPPDDRDSSSTIRPFDQLLYESKERQFRYDVELTIEVRHKKEFLNPLDACESRCVSDMMQSLKRLGVQERTWDEDKARRHIISNENAD